jgi:hypothetical protein
MGILALKGVSRWRVGKGKGERRFFGVPTVSDNVVAFFGVFEDFGVVGVFGVQTFSEIANWLNFS